MCWSKRNSRFEGMIQREIHSKMKQNWSKNGPLAGQKIKAELLSKKFMYEWMKTDEYKKYKNL